MFYRHVNQHVRRKKPNSADKTNNKNSFWQGFFILVLGFPIDIFVNGKIETPLKLHCMLKVPVYERLNSFHAMFSISTLSQDKPYHLLDTIAFKCIRIRSRFCAFPVREKLEISSINAYTYFCGKYSPITDFLKFNSLSTQPFHA